MSYTERATRLAQTGHGQDHEKAKVYAQLAVAEELALLNRLLKMYLRWQLDLGREELEKNLEDG